MMSEAPSSFKELALVRCKDGYEAFAYDESTIRQSIKALHVRNPKIYFADQLRINECVKIDNKNYLFPFNSKIIELQEVREAVNNTLESSYNLFLEKEKPIINLDQNSKSNNTLVSVATVLLLLYMVIFSFDKISAMRAIDKKSDAQLTGNKTFYEIKSLIKKYKKLDDGKITMQEELVNHLKKDQVKSLVYKDGKTKASR